MKRIAVLTFAFVCMAATMLPQEAKPSEPDHGSLSVNGTGQVDSFKKPPTLSLEQKKNFWKALGQLGQSQQALLQAQQEVAKYQNIWNNVFNETKQYCGKGNDVKTDPTGDPNCVTGAPEEKMVAPKESPKKK